MHIGFYNEKEQSQILELVKSFNTVSDISIKEAVDYAIAQYEYFREKMKERR